MKIVLILSLFVILRAKAWPSVRVPFEFLERQNPVRILSDDDCSSVVSEEGDYSFKRVPRIMRNPSKHEYNVVEAFKPNMEVCGLYILADPDKNIEVSVKYLDVNCESGSLMAFVDGWEINQTYFPDAHDHHLSIEERTKEFCSDNAQWPSKQYRKKFHSSQNAALIQYRIPIRGSFVVNVRFFENPTPCNLLAEGLAPFYTLSNYGEKRNCTLTAMYPAAIAIQAISVGGTDASVDYDCNQNSNTDRLDIGGSNDFNTYEMKTSVSVCGNSEKIGPHQAIFCEITTVRLISHGKHNNQVIVRLRKADENDLDIVTLSCLD